MEQRALKPKNSTHICSAATCPSPNGVIYHRFPKDGNIQKAWKIACKRKDKINEKTALVCELHFKEEDYQRDLRNELLNLPIRKTLKTGILSLVQLLSRKCCESKNKKEKN